VEGMTDWGFNFENFSEDTFDHLFSVSNTNGDMRFASTVELGTYEPGNSKFEQLFSSPLNNFAHGIVFAAPGSDSNAQSNLGSVKVLDIQVNRFRDTLTSQSVTPAGGSSTSIAVTDLTKFSVGLPVWFTTTADGFTANVVYFVFSVSGASGSGTVTVALSPSAASAVSTTGSSALTLDSYGFANIEVAGNDSTASPSTVNVQLLGIDIEGYATVGIMDNRSTTSTYQIATSALHGGPSAVLTRTAGQPTFISNGDLVTDIDSASGGIVSWTGSHGTDIQRSPQGVVFDSVLSTWALYLSANTGNTPDVYRRGPNGNFSYPATGMGIGIFSIDTSAVLTSSRCGVIAFNGAASQVLTLPVVDNAGTKSASYQGCEMEFVNASQSNPVTLNTAVVLTSGTYTSGGSTAGTGSCTITFTAPTGGTNAVATVPITSGTITGGATLTITTAGVLGALPTTGAFSNGSGSGVCSGTATVSVAAANRQTFNNVNGLYSITIPTGTTVDVVASETSASSIEFWATTPSQVASGLKPPVGVIFSAAGTPLPTCNAAAAGLTAFVSDATLPTIGLAYTSGGAVYSGMLCTGSGWVSY
jgi:hypothetical protein